MLVFVDALFWRRGDVYSNNRAFTLFASAFFPTFDAVTFLGRMHPQPGEGPYRLPPGTEVEPLPFYPSLYFPGRLLAALPRIARAAWKAVGRSDVVWLCIPHPLALLTWAVARVRRRRVFFLVRQNFVAQVGSRSRGRRLARLAARMLEAVFVRLSSRTLTFTVGGEMKHRYAGGGSLPVEVLISLVPDSALRGALPRRSAEAPGGGTVLWVGRMEPEKGLDTLIGALRILEQCGQTSLHATLVGEGSLAATVRSLVSEAGLEAQVSFTGYVPFGPGLEEIYRRASLLVLPSHNEGFPQVILEAMAAGLPVVASAVGGIPLLLRHGEEALLVPPGKPEALADAIRSALGDAALYSRLSERGLAFVRAHTLEAERGRMLERIDRWLGNSE